jgi:hypothetical protein
MSITLIVAAALAAAPAPASLPTLAVPPIVVDLNALTEVSKIAIANAIEETQAIFRSAGVSFIWRRGEHSVGTLNVVIGTEPGPRMREENSTAIGWVRFENDEPVREIHLSYENALHFMEDSRDVIGAVNRKTQAERDILLGRLLGRALAHELGHYLLATKTHTNKGLLKGSRSAQEFFGPDRTAFRMDLTERRLIAARIRKEFDLVARHN